MNIVVHEFQKAKACGDESFIIPPSFFETRKLFIFIETPYCDFNVIKSKYYLKKFQKITVNYFRIAITWKTRDPYFL